MVFAGTLALSLVVAISMAMRAYEAAGGPSNDTQASPSAITTFLSVLAMGAVLGVALQFVANAKERADASKRDAAAATKAREEALRAESARKKQQAERTREQTAARLVVLAERSAAIGAEATAAIRQCAVHAEWCAQWLDQARLHMRNNALTPFWEAIESALVRLGDYNHGLGRISQLAEEHSRVCVEYLAMGGDVPQLRDFPVTIGSVSAARAALDLESRVKHLVYQAQRDFHFASIYEQRRTTEAVIAGFRNLGSALGGIAAELQRSLASLEHAIAASGAATEAELQRVSRSLEGPPGLIPSLGVEGELRQIKSTLLSVTSRS